MATFYSDEMVKQRAGRNVGPSDWHGKLRVLKWDFASLAASTAADVFVCGRLLAGERVLIGHECNSAAGAGTHDIGTYAMLADGSLGAVIDVDRYTDTTPRTNVVSIASAVGLGNGFFASLVADAANDLIATDCLLCITNIGTAFDTAARLTGWVLLVSD